MGATACIAPTDPCSAAAAPLPAHSSLSNRCLPCTRRRFHVQRFFAVLDSKDISKYDPNNHTIGADIPFSQNMLASAALARQLSLLLAAAARAGMQTGGRCRQAVLLPCFKRCCLDAGAMQVCKLPFTDVPRHYRNIQARPSCQSVGLGGGQTERQPECRRDLGGARIRMACRSNGCGLNR